MGIASQGVSGRYNFDRNNGDDLDVFALFLVFWRQRHILFFFLLMGVAGGVLALGILRPQYTARSVILLQRSALTHSTLGLDSLMFGGSAGSSMVLNEIEILRSSSMAARVIHDLNLMTDPELNPRFEEFLGATDHRSYTNQFKRLSLYGTELDKLPVALIDKDMIMVNHNFRDHLKVRSINDSNVIHVEFTSLDPGKAALIANKIADLYLEGRLEDKYRATQKTIEWLNERLKELRLQLRDSQKAVMLYRVEHNLLGDASNLSSMEQISSFNTQMIEAKMQKAQAQARLEMIERFGEDKQSIEMLADPSKAVFLGSLKEQELALRAEISQLSGRYGEKHPAMINLRKKLDEVHKALSEELGKLGMGAEAELELAQTQIDLLDEGLKELLGQLQEDTSAMVKLAELEQESVVARGMFESFLAGYKKAIEQASMQESDVQVVSYAFVPFEPSHPDVAIVLSLSLLLSVFIGGLVSIFLEKGDSRYRSCGYIEEELGFPCYGLVPKIKNLDVPALGEYVLKHPSSYVAEVVRTLRMKLHLHKQKEAQGAQVITLSSSFSGEGKTTLGLWLARLSAKAGQKVIVIDGDLRTPNLHRAVGRQVKGGLLEYLKGRAELEDIIYEDEASGAHFIFGGEHAEQALYLISSEKYRLLIEALRQKYDLVLIDAPASLMVSDAAALAVFSDQVLYAVAWNKTVRKSIVHGLKQFDDIGYKNIAFVMTHVNLRQHVRYGYGDVVFEKGRYSQGENM